MSGNRVMDAYRRLYDPHEEEARDAEQLRDMQRMISTEAWQELKRRIAAVKSQLRWHQGMTQEQAAASLIAVSVYDQLLEEFTALERQVTEAFRDG